MVRGEGDGEVRGEGDGDAYRGDAHRGAVGVAGGACVLRRRAGQDGGDGALGGGAEKVEGAAVGHVAFPARPGVRHVPGGGPAAMGGPGGAGAKPASRPPQRAMISARDSIWVGIPSASPIASPYSAPLAVQDVFPGSLEDVAAIHLA